MSKVIFLRGLQGSGKSTWAKKWVNEDPNHRIRINRDDIRRMFGKYWLDEKLSNRKRETIISDILDRCLKDAMFLGLDIVIDNMNLNKDRFEEDKELVEYYDKHLKFICQSRKMEYSPYNIECIDFFHVPLDECIRRDSLREEPVGADVIKQTYEKYKGVINEAMIL